jgi:hypothetical protein
MSWINWIRIQREGPMNWTAFDRELEGICNHIIRERGFPTQFSRVDAAKFVTGVKDPGDALDSFNEYFRFLSQPNLILNFPPRWLPWVQRFAASDGLYDQIREELCELLRRYYSGYRDLCKREAAKKIKKSLD